MQAKALLPERCEQSRVLQFPFGAKVTLGKLTATDETRRSSVPREREGMRIESHQFHAAPAAASEDEDDEGRSDNEKLVEEGVTEAEHDQRLQAGKAAAKDT